MATIADYQLYSLQLKVNENRGCQVPKCIKNKHHKSDLSELCTVLKQIV